MDLKIEGRVTEVLEEQSGTGRNGPWRKQEFILETEGEYPRPVCFTQWGEKIDQFDVEEGERLIVHFDLRSREYEGRWYTDAKAWKVERPDQGRGGSEGPPPGPEMDDFPEDDREDDLPF